VKYWEIIADNLSKAGWSWGCVSAIDREGRTIWIADAQVKTAGTAKRTLLRASIVAAPAQDHIFSTVNPQIHFFIMFGRPNLFWNPPWRIRRRK
jgi:hypothetical protein